MKVGMSTWVYAQMSERLVLDGKKPLARFSPQLKQILWSYTVLAGAPVWTFPAASVTVSPAATMPLPATPKLMTSASKDLLTSLESMDTLVTFCAKS